MKALSKDPKARPQTADEFRLALLGADWDSLRSRPAEQRQIPVTRVAAVQTSKGLFQEGQIIRGTYEIERFLGEGAFAEVYRVKHRFFGRQAIKVLKTSSVTLEETEALLSEAVLLSRIGHPNIIRVFHADLADTQEGVRAFFTMEYVAGGSLERFWKSHGSRLMPVGTAVDLVMQTCRGLSVAHSENPPIIHRDIKPQNILVGHDAKGLRVWLTDFGLAKRVNPLTLLASSRGTLCFKAPEALLEGRDSCAGDVWALGTTLYLLLSDRLPFPQEIDDGRLDDPRRFNDPVAPPSRFNVDVNDQLDTITLAALAIDPKDRYRSAVEMLSALEAWNPGFEPGQEVTLSSSGITLPETIGPAVDLSDRKTAAQKMIADALRKAESGSQLQEAAELLDKALRQCPELRSEYV
jgi:serine/threonine-protein kinase